MNITFGTLLLILIQIRDRGKNKFTIENCLRGVSLQNSNDVSRVRDNRINSATPLVIMFSVYMHQLVKSMVNWNIYNDNIMTSGVA